MTVGLCVQSVLDEKKTRNVLCVSRHSFSYRLYDELHDRVHSIPFLLVQAFTSGIPFIIGISK